MDPGRPSRLAELTRRLRAAGQDPTAEEVADAVWLAQWLPSPGAGGGPGGGPDGGGAAGPLTGDGSHGVPHGGAGSGSRSASGDLRDPEGDRRDPAAPTGPEPDPDSNPDSNPDPGTTPASVPPPRRAEYVDLRLSGGARARTSGGAGAGLGAALPVRAPGANALPGLLGLQKALRPLRRYATGLPARPGEGRLDEEATAERSAALGILTPVLRPAAGRRPDIQLLMDTGPAMVVWERMVEELRQACQQSGAFRDVQVHRLYDTGEGPPCVTTTSDPEGRPRLRPADQLHDPTGRRLTLLVSDCVGPLWQRGAAQRLVHQWPRHAPLALVQPLPPRLWSRTALRVEPGALLRPPTPGGQVCFEPDEEEWEPVAGDRRALPVLTPTPEAFASWARLLTGHGGGAVRGWAARVGPPPGGPFAPAGAITYERTTAGGAPGAPAYTSAPTYAPVPEYAPGAARRADDELLRAFRAGASPGAVRLAVHLAAAPLALPVMQLVQRAMLPDTGPMELAEVLLSGLLRRLPGATPYPCFSYPPGVQAHLLGSLDRGAAALVLKHCSEFVERHFGQGTRNFPALAAARLAGHPADTANEPPGTAGATAGASDVPAEAADPTGSLLSAGPGEEDEQPPGAAAELFARIPARVLRFYQPDLVTPEPFAAARRLFAQWRGQSDPALLATARELAEAALSGGGNGNGGVNGDGIGAAGIGAGDGAPVRPEEIAGARLVLGQVLFAQAGTAAVRDRGQRQDLLTRALGELALAAGAAPPGSADWAEARLEQAATLHALWRHNGDTARLDAALDALAGEPAVWPESHRHALFARRGRLLLARGEGPAAVAAFTEALAVRETGPLLLDLFDALHLSASSPDSALALAPVPAPTPASVRDAEADALDRAEPLLGDSTALRLRWTTARARLYDATGDGPAADAAYEQATLLTPADGEQRGRLLLTWGESLLRRAATGTGTAPVDRAESVLREALTSLPADTPARARARVLIGSVLALRYDRAGFLPDLYESRHLLEQAVRAARTPAERAEVWLQLGWVRLRLGETGWDEGPDQALLAYERAAEDARTAHGDTPGTVTLARALHAEGAVLRLTGRHGRAADVLRAAAGQWRRLDAALMEVDQTDIARTRALLAEAEAGPGPLPGRIPPAERRRIAPPWWPWREVAG
ncbi:SAV_2336 N-terminal domain-related protein [Streptomyces sp. NPDC046203]|uniref:SAV_2336 N-terminal domain-related protein n=1 Tax=Streptomyces sp. NPDC046203 TaxID=3154602 RepID=UPI003406BFFB